MKCALNWTSPPTSIRHLPRSKFMVVLCALSLQACSKSVAPVDGAIVFKNCSSCHQVGTNARGGFGPQLNGLFGRRAGSAPDYAYSDAMRRSGITWNAQTLAAFVRNPQETVPGTKMRLWGISDDKEITALIAYLQTYQNAQCRGGRTVPSVPVPESRRPRAWQLGPARTLRRRAVRSRSYVHA